MNTTICILSDASISYIYSYTHNYGSSLSFYTVLCRWSVQHHQLLHHHPQSCNGGDWVRGCQDRTKILARQKQVPIETMNSDACCI